MKFTQTLLLALTTFSASINALAIPADSNVNIVISVKDEAQTHPQTSPRVLDATTLAQPLDANFPWCLGENLPCNTAFGLNCCDGLKCGTTKTLLGPFYQCKQPKYPWESASGTGGKELKVRGMDMDMKGDMEGMEEMKKGGGEGMGVE